MNQETRETLKRINQFGGYAAFWIISLSMMILAIANNWEGFVGGIQSAFLVVVAAIFAFFSFIFSNFVAVMLVLIFFALAGSRR